MNIAVTGLNNIDSPGPGVPVIRGIKDSGKFDGKIIGLIYDSLEPGAYMEDVADVNYLIPYPSSGIEPLLERLAYIHSREKIDLLIPTLDAELYAFVKLQPKLNELGIKTFLPTMEQLNIRAKDKLFDFCQKHEIKAPENILANSMNDLNKIPDEIGFPAAIKGIFYDAYIVQNLEEAKKAFTKIANKWGFPIIAQEFVGGEEFNVVALGDGKGGTVGAVAMKKTYITDKGKAWAGITIKDPKLIEISNKIISLINWKGGAEFEFVKDAKTNEYYLLEINPRFPAWVYLSVGAGQNLPYALVELATGKQVEPFDDYNVGTLFIRYSWDLITDIKSFEKLSVQGELRHE